MQLLRFKCIHVHYTLSLACPFNNSEFYQKPTVSEVKISLRSYKLTLIKMSLVLWHCDTKLLNCPKFLKRFCSSANGLCQLLADAALLECVAMPNLIARD